MATPNRAAAIRKKGQAIVFIFVRNLPQATVFALFVAAIIVPFILPMWRDEFAKQIYAPALNAIVSVGTGGVVSFVFYYVVNARLERHRAVMIRDSVREIYLEAKRQIAFSIIHASQKGGRKDLVATYATVEEMMSPRGFKALFEEGREGDEGFYAFANQMSDPTYEYDEIVFNLKTIRRATERLIDNHLIRDKRTYSFFFRLGTLVDRIERNGPGYDESKPLCSFIWEVFAGWNFIDGSLGYDPIDRRLAKL